MSSGQRNAIPRKDRCLVCDGYGNNFVGWSPDPVRCGHCHGDGRKPDRSLKPYPAGSTERKEAE